MSDRGSRDRGGRGREGRDSDRGREDRDSNRESSSRGRSESRGRGRGSDRPAYHARSPEQWKKREERGGDFDRMFEDGIKSFKVKDGDNSIRIVEPTWDDPEHFGFDIYVHYSIGPEKQTYLCPSKMNNEPCPICEERTRAARSGDEEYAKELEPRKRVLVYLIDRNNEKEGVMIWAMPKSFDTDLISISQDKRTGEILQIDDPFEGYDVDFDKQGSKDRTRYTGISIARRSSELGKEEWRDFAFDHPLPSILKFYPYDHLAAAFGGSAPARGSSRDKEDEEDDRPSGRDRDSGRGRSSSKSRDPEYSFESVHEMTYDEMCDLVEDQKLDIVPEDSDSDEDLADWICEEMNLEETKKQMPRRSSKSDEEDDSPSSKLKEMRNKRDRG